MAKKATKKVQQVQDPQTIRNPNRINSSSLDNAIFRPNDVFKEESDEEPAKEEAEYYSSRGVLIKENSKDIVAKKVYLNNVIKYFCLLGPDAKLYNPIGMYDIDIHKKIHSNPVWNLRQVSKKVFELYVSFLKTKSKTQLNHAERALM